VLAISKPSSANKQETTMPDQLDKDLDEILGGSGQEFQSSDNEFSHTQGKRNPLFGFLQSMSNTNIHPGKVMLASIAFLLVVLILYNSALNHAGPLVWIAVAIFAGAYLLFFVNPTRSAPEKRWRGEVIESRSTLLSRLKKWISR
tara:strand:- start:2619 stop:3053 length:435 start_codon:yes stop_codon:yes gene_type:complete